MSAPLVVGNGKKHATQVYAVKIALKAVTKDDIRKLEIDEDLVWEDR
jgi:hypothetical protein